MSGQATRTASDCANSSSSTMKILSVAVRDGTRSRYA